MSGAPLTCFAPLEQRQRQGSSQRVRGATTMAKHSGETLSAALVHTHRISSPANDQKENKQCRMVLYYLFNARVWMESLHLKTEQLPRLVPRNMDVLGRVVRSIPVKECQKHNRKGVWSFLSLVSQTIAPGDAIQMACATPVSLAGEGRSRSFLVDFIVAACSPAVYNLRGRFAPEAVQSVLESNQMLSLRSLAVTCCSLYNCFTDMAIAHLKADGCDDFLLDLCGAAMMAAVEEVCQADSVAVTEERLREANIPMAYESPEKTSAMEQRVSAGLLAGGRLEECVRFVRARFTSAAVEALHANDSQFPSVHYSLPFSYDHMDEPEDTPRGAMLGMRDKRALPLCVVGPKEAEKALGRLSEEEESVYLFVHPMPPSVLLTMLRQACEQRRAFLVDTRRPNCIAVITFDCGDAAKVRCSVVKELGRTKEAGEWPLTLAGAEDLLRALGAEMQRDAEEDDSLVFNFYSV